MSNRRLFEKRAFSNFSQIFMTYYSIVQGLTLGYIVVIITTDANKLDLYHWAIIVIMFLIVYTNWLEYSINTVYFLWIPGIPDAVIPMSLGLLELFTVYVGVYLAFSYWCFCIGALSILSCIAFSNFYRETKRYPENQEILTTLKIYKWLNYGISTLSFISTVSMGLIIYFHEYFPFGDFILNNDVITYISLLFVAYALFFAIRGIMYWNSVRNYILNDNIENTIIVNERPTNFPGAGLPIVNTVKERDKHNKLLRGCLAFLLIGMAILLSRLLTRRKTNNN